jgi:hypothetical protein
MAVVKGDKINILTDPIALWRLHGEAALGLIFFHRRRLV